MATENIYGWRPYIRKADLDDEATMFLSKYYPLALEYPIAVPATQIASDIGLTLITHERITEDFSVYGQMCFNDGATDIYRPETCEYVSLEVRAGTMLVDQNTKLVLNIGCFNNTVTHELYHWHRHQEFFLPTNHIADRTIVATRCTREQIEGAAKEQRLTDLDWVEWQASSVTPRILMPKDTVDLVVTKFFNRYKSYFNSFSAFFERVADELVRVFHVSRQSATIRLKELGYDSYLRRLY